MSSDGTGRNNPYNVPYNEWWYYNKRWNKPDFIDDIIIQCVESKYTHTLTMPGKVEFTVICCNAEQF